MTYATVSFLEPETQAEQQRTTAIVKTSDKGGYYIDVFRSRKKEGGDKTHDYFYHNLGQEMKVMDAASGKALDMKPIWNTSVCLTSLIRSSTSRY